MNEIIKNTAILTAITFVSGLALGGVYQMTAGPIEARAEQEKTETFGRVLPGAEKFENIDFEQPAEVSADADVLSVVRGLDGAGAELGNVYLVMSHEGYGGDIELAVGIDSDGVVTGVDILSLSETPGLGMRAREPEFIGQFAGRDAVAFSYSKTGASGDEEVDAISGATITTNAVVNAVNTAVAAHEQAQTP